MDRGVIGKVAAKAGLKSPYRFAELAKAYVDSLRDAAAGREQKSQERLDLMQEQARLAAAKADDQERKNRIASGELVNWEEAAAMYAPFGREVRQRLLSMGSKIGPKVGRTVAEQRRLKAAIDEETYKALKALNEYEEKNAR